MLLFYQTRQAFERLLQFCKGVPPLITIFVYENKNPDPPSNEMSKIEGLLSYQILSEDDCRVMILTWSGKVAFENGFPVLKALIPSSRPHCAAQGEQRVINVPAASGFVNSLTSMSLKEMILFIPALVGCAALLMAGFTFFGASADFDFRIKDSTPHLMLIGDELNVMGEIKNKGRNAPVSIESIKLEATADGKPQSDAFSFEPSKQFPLQIAALDSKNDFTLFKVKALKDGDFELTTTLEGSSGILAKHKSANTAQRVSVWKELSASQHPSLYNREVDSKTCFMDLIIRVGRAQKGVKCKLAGLDSSNVSFEQNVTVLTPEKIYVRVADSSDNKPLMEFCTEPIGKFSVVTCRLLAKDRNRANRSVDEWQKLASEITIKVEPCSGE